MRSGLDFGLRFISRDNFVRELRDSRGGLYPLNPPYAPPISNALGGAITFDPTH
jgi:hypothetical protein